MVRVPFLNVDPQPADVPYPSYLSPKGSRSSFTTREQRPPELNEYPATPSPAIDPGVLAGYKLIRRRSGQGLFMTAADVIEADVVQPQPATVFADALRPRGRRRRTRFKQLHLPEELTDVPVATPAGEEYETAWRLPVQHFRRAVEFRLTLPLPYPWEKPYFPAEVLVTAFRRVKTTFKLESLPTLSFYEPRPVHLPAYQAKPTLRRRTTSYRTRLDQVPDEITLRIPPDEQGYPAFLPPLKAFDTHYRVQHIAVDVAVFGQASVTIRLGLQPPHWVIGRMTEHGVSVRGQMSLAATSVAGTMSATHGVNGAFDDSEGHEGSVL